MQAALPFVAAFKEIRESNVKLLGEIQIVGRKITRSENGDELGISSQDRIRTQVRSDLLGLILKDQSASGFKSMIVGQRQINCLIKTNQSRRLPGAGLDCQ